MNKEFDGHRSRRAILRLAGVSLGGLAVGRVAASEPIAVGTAVVTSRRVAVRRRPRPASKVTATLQTDVPGEVVNGPVNRDGVTWWGVRFDRDGGPTWAWCTADALAVDGGGSGGGTGDGSTECSTTVTTEFTGHISGWDDWAIHEYDPKTSDTCEVALSLAVDSDATPDFDLYVTLDGRKPSTEDYDESSVTVGNDERVTIGSDSLDASTELGILVDSYSGPGDYTVTVEESGAERKEPPGTPGDGDGGGDGKFEQSQRVRTTADLVIHESAALGARTVWTAPEGSVGYVRDGPVRPGDGYVWWKVAFNAGYTGWAVGSYLEAAPDEGDGGPRQVRGTFRRPPKDLAQMKADVDEYLSHGVTDLALNTFFHGETIYPSAHATSMDYPDGFLEETIRYAHEKGLKVHAWMLNMYLWNPKYLGDVPAGHILDGSDRVCADGNCASIDRSLITETQGGRATAESGKVFGSPFSDEIVGTLADVAREHDRKFDLDGIAFDYVRYPKSSESFGYGQAADYAGVSDYHGHRVDAITDMVDRCASAVSDETTTSVCVFPSYYRSGSASEYNKAQAWKSWQSETPVDAFVPMCYGYDTYDGALGFCDRANDGDHDFWPALAITEGHDSLSTQFDAWNDYGFEGYMVWKGEAIDRELP